MGPNRLRVAQGLVAFVVLGLWEVLSRAIPTLAFAAASPSRITRELVRLIQGEFWPHVGTTAAEATLGFLLGTTLGTAVGLLLWFSPSIARTFRPYVVIFGAVPVFAFAPLLILLFGIGIPMKVAAAAFSTFFVALSQAYRGAQSASGRGVELLKVMRATPQKTFAKLIVPSSVDWVLNSMRLNAGLALLGAFVGEVISADRGLGYLMMRSAALYDMPTAFAAAVGLAGLAVLLDYLAAICERNRAYLVRIVSVPRLSRASSFSTD